MEKKKSWTITIIVLLIVIGILVYFYKSTEFLKTNQQLFWKYAVKNTEIMEMFNNDQMEAIKNKKTTNSYKSTGNIQVKKYNDIYTLDINTNAKNTNDIFTFVELKRNNNNIIDFNLVKKSNVVGIRMEELANGYITVKNSNLKELAKKVNIEDEQKIPDNINVGTYMDILEISEKDLQYITEKYTNLVISDTNKRNYSKGEIIDIKINDKIHKGTAYKLSLTENECKKILSDIFLELSKDSKVLNLISSKMKLLNLGEEYTQINVISDKFLEISNNINSIETTNEKFIEITVYAENPQLLQTDLKIKQELLNQKQDNNKFILSISDALNKICEQVQEINIQNEVLNDKDAVSTKVDIICKDNLSITYNSTTEITDDVQMSNDYDNSLKIILNDLNENQLNNLYKAVVRTLKSIYNNKKAELNTLTEQEIRQSQEETQYSEQNNSEQVEY